MPKVIEAFQITKKFPGVVANDRVNFDLEKGEIHALLGENGAGKSTLMNVLYGLYEPDEGTIAINGNEVKFENPSDAIRLGIGMVHQHFMLVPVMTVTENCMIGMEETQGYRYLTQAAAALIGGAAGRYMGGLSGLLFWVLVCAGYALWAALKGRLPGSPTVFGVGSGAVLGLLFHFLGGSLADYRGSFLTAPVVGMAVGLIANLRWLDKRRVANRIRQLAEDYGFNIDPAAYVRDLPVGAQQRIEIIKALYRNAQVLILDEPTAVLTPQEVEDLFGVMRNLCRRGVSIIFITHKLREVLAVADRITVMRLGKVIGTVTPAEASPHSLARMMVGREVMLQVDREESHPLEKVLEVHDLYAEDIRHHQILSGVSFQVRQGEIVGLAGVQGNGQTELIECITGLRGEKAGRILIMGHEITSRNPRMLFSYGMSHVPEDRHKHGLVLNHPVTDNLILVDFYRSPFSKGIIQVEEQIEAYASRLVEEFDIRTPSIFTPAGKLSGGNQQKVIVARELSRQPKLLVANQPTRGLDVGSIEYIHSRIVQARDHNAGILLVSTELDEIMALSDRIVVMYQGKITAELSGAEATRERLGLLMAGGHLLENGSVAPAVEAQIAG